MSRITLMPSAMVPKPSPCSPRPIRNGSNAPESAHTTEPTPTQPMLPSSAMRLPYMSPRRPPIGVTTAPTRRVMVSAHEVLPGSACSSVGNCGMSGTMIVCMSATTMPAAHSTVTAARG